jgi:hypothetical protein
MEGFVTVRTFTWSTDYEMVRSYLESFEIECFGQDEILNRDYANANGGIKLQVRSEQAEEAIKLLLDAGYLKVEDFEPSAEVKWVEKILNYFKRKE